MEKRKFSFKIEELVVIAAVILASVRKDIADFAAFSSVFTVEFLDAIAAKLEACKTLINASTIAKELKLITKDVNEKSAAFRTKLNALETYFKYAAGQLDIQVSDAGIKAARLNISRGNTEGVVSALRVVLANARRNRAALEAKGMKPEFLTAFEAGINEIEALNNKQITLKNDMARQTDTNMATYNDLWSDICIITDAAKAIYRGVDDVKLKDYNVSLLRKRINAEGSNTATTTDNSNPIVNK